MMEMTRKEAIEWLKIIKANMRLFPEISATKKVKALEMAISSLEVDEMYQLEFEKTTGADK